MQKLSIGQVFSDASQAFKINIFILIGLAFLVQLAFLPMLMDPFYNLLRSGEISLDFQNLTIEEQEALRQFSQKSIMMAVISFPFYIALIIASAQSIFSKEITFFQALKEAFSKLLRALIAALILILAFSFLISLFIMILGSIAGEIGGFLGIFAVFFLLPLLQAGSLFFFNSILSDHPLLSAFKPAISWAYQNMGRILLFYLCIAGLNLFAGSMVNLAHQFLETTIYQAMAEVIIMTPLTLYIILLNMAIYRQFRSQWNG